MYRTNRLAAALLSGGSALVLASVASAQVASAPANASDAVEEVVVTGSRVITNGNQSPTPVTVVSAEQMLHVQPTTISEALNTLPQFGGSQTSTSGPGSGVRNGSAAYITLRNAGDNHTLVLFDGHRVLPAAPQESHASDVDINLLPQMLLQRVDIVTGGASAVYGSDAVSGVVNFVTDRNFNGLKLQGSVGQSTYGDGRTYDGGIAVGRRILNDKGHIEFSFEYRDDPGILNPEDKYDRPFFQAVNGGGGLGTAASPYVLVPNQRLANTSFGGKIVAATGALAGLNNMNFKQDGVLSPFVDGAAVVGSAAAQSGGDGAYYRNSSIKSSLLSKKAFGRFDYDLSDSTHAYLQYGYSRNKSAAFYQTSNPTFNVSLSNPFLDSVAVQAPGLTTAQFQALRTANPNGSFRMSKMLLEQEKGLPIQSTMEFQMLLGGIDGKLGDYRWQLSFGHQLGDQEILNKGNLHVGRFLAAVDAVRDSSGRIVCRAALTNPTYSGCVPLNPFGPTAESRAALDYVTSATSAMTHVKMDELQGSITGAPFSTWAGPVNMALSGEWRRVGYNLISNAEPGDLADCAGMLFSTLSGNAVTGNCNGPNSNNPTTVWGQQNTLTSLNPGVSVSVKELAVEADVPLLNGVSFAKSLDLNLAARWTDYSTSGQAWTWKVGLIWQVTDELRLRATRSHDIRAPNLYELYSPPAISIQSFTDFVVNGVGTTQTGIVPLVGVSDPNMKNEVADTMTAGFIYQSTRFPGLSVSLDAYRIKMRDAIFQVRSIDRPIINACIASGGTSEYCSWYVRPTPTSFPTRLLRYNLNIASQDTYGADVEVNYAGEAWGRSFLLRALLNYQPHNIFDQGAAGEVDMGGAYAGGPAGVGPSPTLRATLIGRFGLTRDLSVTIMERWRSSMHATGSTFPIPASVYAVDRVPAVAYTNLTVNYTIHLGAKTADAYVNVQNLFNKFSDVPVGGPPSSIPGRGINPMPLGDDPIGRFVQVGLRLRM